MRIKWQFDSAFPADRIDPTTRVNNIARPLNSYYLYSKPNPNASAGSSSDLYLPIMHKDLNVIGYKIILEKKTGTDSHNVDISEPISQVFIPLPDAVLGQHLNQKYRNVWDSDLKTDVIRQAEHVLKINKTFPTIDVQSLSTNAIAIQETIVSGIGPSSSVATGFGSYLKIGKMDGITGTQKIKLYCYEIRV